MPNLSEKNLEKLRGLLEVANDGLSKEEFLEAFKKLTDHIFKVETKLIEKIEAKTQNERQNLEALRNQFNEVINQAKRDSDITLSGFRTRTVEAINKLFARNEVNKKLNERLRKADDKFKEIDQKLLEVKDGRTGRDGVDGKDGKDADEEKIIESVLSKLEDVEFGIDDIKGLKKELEDLRNIRTRVRGGGTSAIGIANAAKYFVKTEAPSGDIDGVNTEYAVTQPIFAVLSFSLNGEFIAQIPNYTVSGKTITFSTALPSAYSGKDFEVTYI